MRLVVDTNNIFSGMLNTSSRISRIILQPKTNLNFYSAKRLLAEINEHSGKLIEIAGYSVIEFQRVFMLSTRKIRLIDIKLIPKETLIKTLKLTSDVDDNEFIALTDHIKG